MSFETVIEKAEAAFLVLQGLECNVGIDSKTREAMYVFKNCKPFEEARKRFAEDCDLQEYLESRRRLEWMAREKRCGATTRLCK